MSEMTLVVYLVPDIRFAPTPLDRCEYVGSNVYCYFGDLGSPVKTFIGHIDTEGEYKGKLEIVTSGNGHHLLAKEVEKRVATTVALGGGVNTECAHCGGNGVVKGGDCWGCKM